MMYLKVDPSSTRPATTPVHRASEEVSFREMREQLSFFVELKLRTENCSARKAAMKIVFR
jgi:hypothetical protein